MALVVKKPVAVFLFVDRWTDKWYISVSSLRKKSSFFLYLVSTSQSNDDQHTLQNFVL